MTRPRSRQPEADHEPATDRSAAGYAARSRRPLQVLVFLLPLVVAYEAALLLVLDEGPDLGTRTVEAHRQLLAIFSTLGVAPDVALFLGGGLIVAVLLAWQVLAREPWRAGLGTGVLMGIESLAWSLPLLALGSLAAGGALLVAPAAAAAADAAADVVGAAPTLAQQLAIAIGAGLYEELFFRMFVLAAVHTALLELARLRPTTASLGAVLVSALAFAAYHDPRGPDGALLPRQALFFALAGAWFGGLFLLRGFGIVVGTHAAYDVVIVLLRHATESEG